MKLLRTLSLVSLFLFIFFACEKENENISDNVTPTTPPPFFLLGLYVGQKFVEVTPDSMTRTDSVYCFVDTISTGIYEFKLYSDSLLTNFLNSYTIKPDNSPIKSCSIPSYYYESKWPDCIGMIPQKREVTHLDVISCTKMTIKYDFYCNYSIYHGFTGEKVP